METMQWNTERRYETEIPIYKTSVHFLQCIVDFATWTMRKEVCFKVLLLLLTDSAVDARDTVPARVNVVMLEGNGNTCPSDDQREEARDELRSNINEILRHGSFSYPASSCANISSNYPSGYY